MVWYRNPTRLWVIIGLLVAGLGLQLLGTSDQPTGPKDFRTQTEEVDSNKYGPRVMVRRFMEARLRGHGAQHFIASHARGGFERGEGLAPLYPRSPLKDFHIAFVDGPLGGPSYEVGVELVFERGSYGDTLFVSFRDHRYVITGGRPSLTGP